MFSALLQQLPNLLSLLRLGAGLVFYWLPPGVRLPVIIGAIVTDLADGETSRLLHADSKMGQVLDPIADKTFVAGAVVALWADGTLNAIEIALVALRDVLVLAAAIWVILRDGRSALGRMQARFLGKVTMGLQFLFFVAVFAELDGPRQVLLWSAAIVGAAAAVDYARAYLVRPGKS